MYMPNVWLIDDEVLSQLLWLVAKPPWTFCHIIMQAARKRPTRYIHTKE